jgi:Na+-transporting methylmalonyl-CoA/oxaloacetate decarboxylase beta subunit
MLILADFGQIIGDFINETGIAQFFQAGGWKNLIMIAVACLLLYLAVAKKFEPYLLIPIATGMLLVNLPGSGIFVNSTKELYNLQEFASLAGISIDQATAIFTHLGLDLSGTYQLGQLVVADQAYVDMLNTLNLSEVQIQNIIVKIVLNNGIFLDLGHLRILLVVRMALFPKNILNYIQ